jgi:GGDEF domain-containing protein
MPIFDPGIFDTPAFGETPFAVALSSGNLRGLQRIASRFLRTIVSIEHKKPFAVDSSDPYGDDIVLYNPPFSAYGWLIPILGKTLSQSDGQISQGGQFKLRVAVGVYVEPEDRVTIEEELYTVVDVSCEATWPIFTTAMLDRIQPTP